MHAVVLDRLKRGQKWFCSVPRPSSDLWRIGSKHGVLEGILRVILAGNGRKQKVCAGDPSVKSANDTVLALACVECSSPEDKVACSRECFSLRFATRTSTMTRRAQARNSRQLVEISDAS